MSKPVIKVLVTGAAGQIAYSLLPLVASGAMLGKDQPVVLHLLDIPPALDALNGVVLELQDGAYPLLAGIVATTDVQTAFTDIDIACLVGAMPRREGMVRADLLKANAKIFTEQGAALDKYAKKTVKTVVVGNPANTNALIAATCAPSLPKSSFSALTRLDHNRARSQIALKAGVSIDDVANTIIWGNHSGTQYPDASHATVKGASALAAVNDEAWIQGDFVSTVQQRGAAIIKARKLSSAMSAANAIAQHVHDWVLGTPEGQFVSMGIWSDGNTYGIPEGLVYSVPVTCKDGVATPVTGLAVSDFSRAKMDATAQELAEEKTTALEFVSAPPSRM